MLVDSSYAPTGPSRFAMQYLGLLVFMIGDGVEVGYLSPYLVEQGFSEHFVALLLTIYGITAAVGAWISGILCDSYGCRKVVALGMAAWVVPEILFLGIALPSHSAFLVLLTYGARGFGYPTLAYGILTFVVKEVRPDKRGLSVGIFWFCMTCGLPTLGTVVAGFFLPRIGSYGTLWVSLAAAIVGGTVALLRWAEGRNSDHQEKSYEIPKISELFSIARANRSLTLTCIVRAINSSATHGIIVFMPFYFVKTLGLPNSEWLTFLEVIFASNILCNVIAGGVGDFLSWRFTVMWIGGAGSGIACLLLYWVPGHYGHLSLFATYGSAAFFGLTLAGYVPLSALTPSLLPARMGVAMSFLNLGAGCSVWLGPLIVYLFQPMVGVSGVITIYSALFFLSGVLVHFIRLPVDEEPRQSRLAPDSLYSDIAR